MAGLELEGEYSASDNRPQGGEEWSSPWGTPAGLWYCTLLPRLGPYLDVDRIIELGSGYGRLSNSLSRHAKKELVLVDMIDDCVRACQAQFANNPKVRCVRNDGRSLNTVRDDSVDLVVSFYSLVGADYHTLTHYVREIARVLSPDGVAFIHHSNAGQYRATGAASPHGSQMLPPGCRDNSVSADDFSLLVDAHGLMCIRQECVSWGVEGVMSDCFSTIVRVSSKWSCDPEYISNPSFCDEMSRARRMAIGARFPVASTLQ